MNPHLPLHSRIPYNRTGAQTIRIAAKLVCALRMGQKLPNAPLTTIIHITLRRINSQQRCRHVVIGFGGQIGGLQPRSTLQANSLKSTTELFSQLTLYIGAHVPSDREPLVRLDLQRGHNWILFIQEEERRVTVSAANAHAKPRQHFWQPLTREATRVHTHVFSDSGLDLAIEALDLTVCARVASQSLTDSNARPSAHRSKCSLELFARIYSNPPRFAVLR